MNRKFHVACVAAGAFLVPIILAAAFTPQYQPFAGGSQGGVPSAGSPATWTYGAGCSNDVVYATTNTTGSFSLNVPGLSSATNLLTSQIGEATKVWTDFWTVPVKCDEGYFPTIDTNATAQVYMNASSNWVAYSGTGSGGLVTNEILATTTASSYGYYRVSILSDYGVKKYSLFINDNCIGTNLNFISTNTADETSRWFIIQNGGGTNACFFDEYQFTTNMSGVLTNEVAGGGISQSDALMLFGTVAPRPVATNAAIIGTEVAWKFGVEGTGESIVLGGATTNTITTSNGVLNTTSGQFTNDMASVSKYFYKIIRRSADSSVTITNAEIYAAYKQERAQRVSYIVGTPVNPLDGDRTLGGPLGRQLASGLSLNDEITVYSGGTGVTYPRDANGNWVGASGVTLAPGQGVKITRLSMGATSSSIIAGTLPTNSITPIPLAEGPNAVAWPYEKSGSLNGFANLTGTNGYALNDYILVQTNSTQVLLGYYCSPGVWRENITPGAGNVFNPTLKAGDGMIIYHTNGVTATWGPQ